jgi:hypothetical protein
MNFGASDESFDEDKDSVGCRQISHRPTAALYRSKIVIPRSAATRNLLSVCATIAPSRARPQNPTGM